METISAAVALRQDLIISFMNRHPQGCSTLALMQSVGISKAECMTVISRLKAQGFVSSNGLRSKDHWIYKPAEAIPKVNSVWQFADFISGQMRLA